MQARCGRAPGWGGVADGVAAGALFERLRKVLQNIPVPGTRADQRLSCRVGSAELQPGASVKETLRRADESLYRAKPSGRNRLVLAETPDLATT